MPTSKRRRPVDVTKDPDAKLDYGFDWSQWLQTGETVTVSAWTVDTGLTISSSPAPTINGDGNITSVWLESGAIGINYLLKNHITTSSAREDDRTMKVHVVNR